jgi:hypothetical protein
MESVEFNAYAERINEGAPIAQVEAYLIEGMWEALSRMPAEKRQHVSVGLGAFARVNPNFAPPSPEQTVALLARYALLDALIERGILDDYMRDELLRKRVFAAAASLPCDKNDLSEALAQKILRESPAEVVASTKEEMRLAGYDPDHPKVGDKFIEWMCDTC